MKKRIKSALFYLLYYSGLERILAQLIWVRGVAVLMYHGVCERSALPSQNNFHHAPEVFEAQMRILRKRYKVLALGEVVERLRAGAPLEKGIVLTFDDGYRNNAQLAAPILRRFGFPFSVFLATDFVDKGEWIHLNRVYGMWFDGQLTFEQMTDLRSQIRGKPYDEVAILLNKIQIRPSTSPAAEESFAMLSWDQVRELANGGAEIGSHTIHHCNMAAESPASQIRELSGSKLTIERQLGRSIDLFAYPYGRTEHMSESSRQSIIETGYGCALSTERGIVTSRSDRFRLPRLGSPAPVWFFACDILYEFVRQFWADTRSSKSTVSRGAVLQDTGTSLG